MTSVVRLSSVILLAVSLFPISLLATQEDVFGDDTFERSQPQPNLDELPPGSVVSAAAKGPSLAAGPIISANSQPTGSLSGRVIYMSGGHGWAASGSTWALARPASLVGMNEDTGNVDQMTLFAYYCFNAGATVVPFRPVGNQTNEVVLDNDDPGVAWTGNWTNSTSSIFYGSSGDAVRYRFTPADVTETATATYTPMIPQTGYYPVYCWTLGSSNRTNQLYRINHTGGQSLVRVPHRLTGGGWIYLGSYYFNAGSNAASGSVIISNLGENGTAAGMIIADAIRFGNGMGDVDEGGGVSTYPREDESNLYWVQRSMGQGRSSTILSSGVSSPIKMAAEMNNEAVENLYKRAYVGFHSNATTGNTNSATARGVIALYNDPVKYPGTTTPNQYDYALKLASEVNSDMVGLSSLLEFPWQSRSSLTYSHSDFAYGEINNTVISNEFDATIVEVAFHDNHTDGHLMRDPKVRNWVARSVLQGMVRYMNAYDAAPLVFLPEPPWNVRALDVTNGVRISWEAPIAHVGSGAATGYVVYRSRDGYGFGQPLAVSGSSTTSVLIAGLEPGVDYYFRVAAVNAGGESMPSETVGCRPAMHPASSKILIVNGFSRFDRTSNLRHTLAAENFKPVGHDGNSGATERVLPERVNAFNYVVPHGKAIVEASQMPFDSCQARAATNGTVPLSQYKIVIWNAGNQSIKDRTFTINAQSRLVTFRYAGGHMFVSGSDVAYDLGRQTGPSVADRVFLTNHLHAALASDTHNSSGVWTVTARAGSIFAGNSPIEIDDGSKGIYWVGSPDGLTPSSGSVAALDYPGKPEFAAAVHYRATAGKGGVIYMGFPFETITAPAVRSEYMADVLKEFSRTPVINTWDVSGGQFVLSAIVEPGYPYLVESSTNLLTWTSTPGVNTNGILQYADSIAGSPKKFYRIRLGP